MPKQFDLFDNSEPEIWRDVPGWEGAYQASTLGRVRSVDRTRLQKSGKTMKLRGKVLSGKPDRRDGYPRVILSSPEKRWTAGNHQVVAFTFLGPPPPHQEVRHLNGNPGDARLSNLCYGTRLHNIEDARRHGTFTYGERRHGAKLTELQAIEILTSMESSDVLAKRFGVKRGTVMGLRAGVTWRHLGYIKQPDRRRRGAESPLAKLTEEQAREALASPISARKLAKGFGVNKKVILNVRSGYSWVHLRNAIPGINGISPEPATLGPKAVIGRAPKRLPKFKPEFDDFAAGILEPGC